MKKQKNKNKTEYAYILHPPLVSSILPSLFFLIFRSPNLFNLSSTCFRALGELKYIKKLIDNKKIFLRL